MTLRPTGPYPNYVTDVAMFKTFCQLFHDNFAATGMVQVMDTGTLVISAIAAKPALNTPTPGFEIWRFNDALQSTSPLFVKVEYGVANNVNIPQMWISVGTGTNGAGTLTFTGWPGATAVITRRPMQVSTSTPVPAQTLPVFFTYLSDNSWAFLAWPTPTIDSTGVWFFSVERFRNADGTPNGDGVTTMSASTSGTTVAMFSESRLFLAGATQMTAGNQYWQIPYTPQGQAGCVLGTTMYPLPVFTGISPRIAAPSQFVVGLGQTDYGAGLTFTCDHYGAPHLFVSAGPGQSTTGFSNLTPVGFHKSFAIRAD